MLTPTTRLRIASRAVRILRDALNRSWTRREDVLSRLRETRGPKTDAWAQMCRADLWAEATVAREDHHWLRREHATAWREFVAAQAAVVERVPA